MLGLLALPASRRLEAQAPGSLPDSLFQRAQRLFRSGDAAGGATLLDSIVRSTRGGTDAQAQALYWRATLTPDSTIAESDYVAIIVDHALSTYAADALLRLGQIEYARGAHALALNHFERLVLEHRSSASAADGWFWLGLTRMRANDPVNGCIALDSAKNRIPESNVELLNRVAFVAQPCAALVAQRADTAVSTPPPPPPPPPPPSSSRWSTQVAAFRTSADAERMVRALVQKGHAARVDTSPPFYRVRIGSFATRAEAVSMVAKLKRENIDAIVVEATRREP
jgi:hypothetical protein